MKKSYLLISGAAIIAMAVSAPMPALAQGTLEDLETDVRARVSAEVDKKISKGLHATFRGELRTEDNFSRIESFRGTAGLEYKINDYVKAGIGYTFIDHQNSSSEWLTRHRLNADVTGSYRVGDWKLSLQEELQLTHRTEALNQYQKTRNPLTLSSRFKVQYKGFKAVEPYAYVELRNVLNDPKCSATYSTSEAAYSNYSFLGYSDVYFNRCRGALGLDWALSRHNTIEVYTLFDYNYNKNIDTDKAGTALRSLTYSRSFNTIAGIGYKFSF